MLSNSGSFDAASLERLSPSQENYVQPNLGHGLRIWWAYYWPTSLISFFIIVVLTVLLRKAWENDVLSTRVVLWANRILPYVVISAVSILGIWRILGKKFRSFSIALLPALLLLVASLCPGPLNEHCASGGNSSGATLSIP